MKDFYLNRQFFNTYLGCYYPLGDDFFLLVKSAIVVPNGYKKQYVYDCDFCVHFESDFVVVFSGNVCLSACKIQLLALKYVLDSELRQSLSASFPISPAWLIPCTRVNLWLKRCLFSLRVYRNTDWC